MDMTPAEASDLIKRLNSGGSVHVPTTLPPPPPGWVEPELPPEIQAEIARAQGVGGTPPDGAVIGVEVPERGNEVLTPPRPPAPIRPAHSLEPEIRSVDLVALTLATNDGAYTLSAGEAKAIREVCYRAVARNLREYLKRLKG